MCSNLEPITLRHENRLHLSNRAADIQDGKPLRWLKQFSPDRYAIREYKELKNSEYN